MQKDIDKLPLILDAIQDPHFRVGVWGTSKICIVVYTAVLTHYDTASLPLHTARLLSPAGMVKVIFQWRKKKENYRLP